MFSKFFARRLKKHQYFVFFFLISFVVIVIVSLSAYAVTALIKAEKGKNTKGIEYHSSSISFFVFFLFRRNI